MNVRNLIKNISVKCPTITRYFPLHHASATMNELNSGTQMEYSSIVGRWEWCRGVGEGESWSPSFTTPDSPSEPHSSPVSSPHVCHQGHGVYLHCQPTGNYWSALFGNIMILVLTVCTHNYSFTGFLTCKFYLTNKLYWLLAGHSGLELVLFDFPSNMVV